MNGPVAVQRCLSDEFLIIVDNLDGTRAYRVESFVPNVNLARLAPVFDNGKTTADFSRLTSFRLCFPGMQPEWLYRSARELLAHSKPEGLTEGEAL